MGNLPHLVYHSKLQASGTPLKLNLLIGPPKNLPQNGLPAPQPSDLRPGGYRETNSCPACPALARPTPLARPWTVWPDQSSSRQPHNKGCRRTRHALPVQTGTPRSPATASRRSDSWIVQMNETQRGKLSTLLDWKRGTEGMPMMSMCRHNPRSPTPQRLGCHAAQPQLRSSSWVPSTYRARPTSWSQCTNPRLPLFRVFGRIRGGTNEGFTQILPTGVWPDESGRHMGCDRARSERARSESKQPQVSSVNSALMFPD